MFRHCIVAVAFSALLIPLHVEAVSLESLISMHGSVTAGDKVFSDFTNPVFTVSAAGAIPQSLSGIEVTPIVTAMGPGLRFTASGGSPISATGSHTASGFVEMSNLQFHVTPLVPSEIVAMTLRAQGFSTSNAAAHTAAFLTVAAPHTVNADFFFGVPGTQTSTSAFSPGLLAPTIGFNLSVDANPSPPALDLEVASLDFVELTFAQRPLQAVSEPATLALVTVGVAGLRMLSWRLRRSRN